LLFLLILFYVASDILDVSFYNSTLACRKRTSLRTSD
jgi:hypothetical protein